SSYIRKASFREVPMKVSLVVSTALSSALWLLIPVSAQDKKAEGVSPVSVTGCLAQGDERNEYAVKDASGKTYGLKAGSEFSYLQSHVGHKVTVTGTPLPEKKQKVKAGK